MSDCIRLGPEEVHIWRATLDVSPAVLGALSSTLAANEVERAVQFRFVRHRDLFTAGRGILRHILSRYMRMAPQALRLRSARQGKLYCDDDRCGIHFNVSHSGASALYAVARREVGVDLEQIDAGLAAPEVAARVFTNREFAQWRALSSSTRVRAFFDCWTRKEACLKGCAEGLSLSLNELDVWSPVDEQRVFSHAGQTWLLRSLNPATGYSAAVAVEGGCAETKYMNFVDSMALPQFKDVAPGA